MDKNDAQRKSVHDGDEVRSLRRQLAGVIDERDRLQRDMRALRKASLNLRDRFARLAKSNERPPEPESLREELEARVSDLSAQLSRKAELARRLQKSLLAQEREFIEVKRRAEKLQRKIDEAPYQMKEFDEESAINVAEEVRKATGILRERLAAQEEECLKLQARIDAGNEANKPKQEDVVAANEDYAALESRCEQLEEMLENGVDASVAYSDLQTRHSATEEKLAQTKKVLDKLQEHLSDNLIRLSSKDAEIAALRERLGETQILIAEHDRLVRLFGSEGEDES